MGGAPETQQDKLLVNDLSPIVLRRGAAAVVHVEAR